MNSISSHTLKPLLGILPTIEEMREHFLECWGSDEYFTELENRVKSRNPVLFTYLKNNPTYSPVYEVISQLYKNEEWLWLVERFLTCSRDQESHMDFGNGEDNPDYKTN
tara:strand:+ start:190 stop:516 length:327 start_codon:yes stop_codon:yes gene_type:complete